MQTIRSFIAIPLATDIRQAAVKLLERLRQPNDGIKWVPTDNLHLTLKFLGEVDNTEVPRVCDVIRQVTATLPPFEISFAGTGGFPQLERPRILFVGVNDPGSLVAMVSGLESALAELGFKPEPRDYRPHLTIGRTRGGSRRADASVVERLRQEQDLQLGTMTADCVQLFASFLDKGGPTYQVMDTVELG